MSLLPKSSFILLPCLLLCGGAWSSLAQQPPPAFSQIVVFGDSLSDTGNVRDRTNSTSGGTVDYPSHTYNYSDGRFTNSSETNPPSIAYAGLWHEQLARTFLSVPVAAYSLGGGTDYAFGGATTKDGTVDVAIVPTPSGDLIITIDNMGKQLDNYLAAHAIDPNALYIVWGGTNDLLQDDSAASVTATAARATALVHRLAMAGAQFIMVPNVPPLGDDPTISSDPARIRSLNAASANYRSELNAGLVSSLSALAPQGITPTMTSGGRGIDATHDRAILRQLLALAPPGIDELYALASLGEALAEGRFERIIVDPAPTGHLLRLVEMPALALEWSHRLMRLMLKYKDVAGLGDAAEELLGFSRRTRALEALLSDPLRAGVVLVTLDEPLVRAESLRLAAALAGTHVAVVGVVRNRVTDSSMINR